DAPPPRGGRPRPRGRARSGGPPPELPRSPPQQHAGEMSLDRSGCLHVIARVKVLSERADRRLDIAMCQGRFGLTRAYRRRADAEIGEAQILETLAISPRAGGKSHHGVVAVAARELGEADAGGAVRHRNTDGREAIAP